MSEFNAYDWIGVTLWCIILYCAGAMTAFAVKALIRAVRRK